MFLCGCYMLCVLASTVQQVYSAVTGDFLSRTFLGKLGQLFHVEFDFKYALLGGRSRGRAHLFKQVFQKVISGFHERFSFVIVNYQLWLRLSTFYGDDLLKNRDHCHLKLRCFSQIILLRKVIKTKYKYSIS